MSDFDSCELPDDHKSQSHGPTLKQFLKGLSAVAFGFGVVGIVGYGIDLGQSETYRAAGQPQTTSAPTRLIAGR